MQERRMKKHLLVSSASHNGVLLCTTCVYVVSLDYEISLPPASPYHTSQQAADLVFEPTMKRSQNGKNPTSKNFELSRKRQKTRENNFTKLTSLMLDFAKKNVGKIADFGLQFPFPQFPVV